MLAHCKLSCNACPDNLKFHSTEWGEPQESSGPNADKIDEIVQQTKLSRKGSQLDIHSPEFLQSGNREYFWLWLLSATVRAHSGEAIVAQKKRFLSLPFEWRIPRRRSDRGADLFELEVKVY